MPRGVLPVRRSGSEMKRNAEVELSTKPSMRGHHDPCCRGRRDRLCRRRNRPHSERPPRGRDHRHHLAPVHGTAVRPGLPGHGRAGGHRLRGDERGAHLRGRRRRLPGAAAQAADGDRAGASQARLPGDRPLGRFPLPGRGRLRVRLPAARRQGPARGVGLRAERGLHGRDPQRPPGGQPRLLPDERAPAAGAAGQGRSPGPREHRGRFQIRGERRRPFAVARGPLLRGQRVVQGLQGRRPPPHTRRWKRC